MPRRWIWIAALLIAPGVAHAQKQVEVRSPGDPFMKALEAGSLRTAMSLIEPDTKQCIADAGGNKASADTLDICVLLLPYYAMTLLENARGAEALAVAKQASEVAAAFGAESEVVLVANFILGLTLERMGQHAAAEKPFSDAHAVAEKLLPDSPDLAPYLSRKANNLTMLAHYAEAVALAERAVKLAGDTADGNFFRLIHGNALMSLGRLAEAEATFRIGLARVAALMGAQSEQALGMTEALALCLERQNRADEAITLWRTSLKLKRAGPQGPWVADTLTGLGVALMRTGELREAETVLREALTLRLRYLGEASNYTGLAYSNLGMNLLEAGQAEEAVLMFSRALAVLSAAGGANPEELYMVLNNMAIGLGRIGAMEQSVDIQRQALAVAESLGPGTTRAALARNNLAAMLGKLGQRREAIRLLQASYDAASKLGGEGVQLRAVAGLSLAAMLAEEGDKAGAERWYAKAEADSRVAFRPDHQNRINVGWGYGNFLMKEGRGLPLARTLLREAGRQVLARASAGTGFDARAQAELSAFTIVFRDQVRVAWKLAPAR